MEHIWLNLILFDVCNGVMSSQYISGVGRFDFMRLGLNPLERRVLNQPSQFINI